MANFITDYINNSLKTRQHTQENYGVGKGRSEQVTTPGIYADSLLGRCSACEDYVESSRYQDVMKQKAEADQLENQASMDEMEVERRKKLLDNNELHPYTNP